MNELDVLHGNYSIAYICLLFAWLLPYVLVSFGRKGGNVDNRMPRASVDAAVGWRKRAYWAHLNAFEAFAPFAVGVVLCRIEHVMPYKVANLALAFVFFRTLHGILYLTDKATLRTLAFVLGMSCIGSLYWLAF